MPQDADLDLMDALVQTAFAVTAILSQAATARDVSLTQLRALAILRDRNPKMAELAAYLGVDRSSVSGLIDRADKRGLVRRTASEDDGRSVRVTLTDEGQALAVHMTAEIGAQLAPLTDRLGAADQKRLSALLNRLLH